VTERPARRVTRACPHSRRLTLITAHRCSPRTGRPESPRVARPPRPRYRMITEHHFPKGAPARDHRTALQPGKQQPPLVNRTVTKSPRYTMTTGVHCTQPTAHRMITAHRYSKAPQAPRSPTFTAPRPHQMPVINGTATESPRYALIIGVYCAQSASRRVIAAHRCSKAPLRQDRRPSLHPADTKRR
jgi:hypothetical protein